MKIRIKGNTVRYRLTKTDVQQLCTTGILEESTLFPTGRFTYAIQSKENSTQLGAELLTNTIRLFIPFSFLQNWDTNQITGIASKLPLPGNDSLNLLVEKDFVCLDETHEDQRDNYENPNKTSVL